MAKKHIGHKIHYTLNAVLEKDITTDDELKYGITFKEAMGSFYDYMDTYKIVKLSAKEIQQLAEFLTKGLQQLQSE